MSTITFKYQDKHKKWGSVAVAGSFNDWSIEKTHLDYDPTTNTWIKEIKLSSSPFTKLYYKYILDGINWVLDDSEGVQTETDESGNINNIGFTDQVIRNPAGEEIPTNEDLINPIKNENQSSLNIGLNDNKDVQNNEASESESKESSDTLSDNDTDQEKGGVESTDSVKEDALNQRQTNSLTSSPNSLDKASLNIWQYIKWFFEFYILSLFTSS